MFKKNIKNKVIIIKIWAWYNKNTKILNLMKKSPTGGSPVNEKTKNKNKFLLGTYFWRKILKFVIDHWVTIYRGTWEIASTNKLKMINK